MIDEKLLRILCCPACKSNLQLAVSTQTLNCSECAREYPIREGIPIMLVDEAFVDRNRAAMLIGSDNLIRRTSPSPQQSPFTATYFPWSVILKPATLKRALLYFDKIFLLGPPANVMDRFLQAIDTSNFRGGVPGVDLRETQSMLAFYESIKPLREAGVVEMLDTNKVLSSKDAQQEIKQQCFEDIVCDYALPSRSAMLLDDLLSSANRAPMFHAIEGSREGALAVQYWEAATVSRLYQPIALQVQKFLDDSSAKSRPFLEAQLQQSGATTRALLLNASVLAIHREGSVPLTDSRDDFAYLSNKYRRMFDSTYLEGASVNARAIERHVARLDTRSGLLSAMALEVMVPNIDCENFEDVLEIRDRFQDHLQSFRLKMMSLATNLKTTVADQEFERECLDLIATKIAPELLDLQKSVRLSRLKVLNKLVKKTLSLKPTIPFIVSVFAPVPLYAAALVSAGIVSLETALEMYVEKQDLVHNNGLAYLMDVNKGELELNADFWRRSSSLP